MKSVIISSICISSVLLVLMIQSNTNEMACYKQELEESLSISVSQTLKEVMEQESFGIQDRNEFIAAFLQALVVRTNSDVDMTVSIISADLERGLLDVEVKERVAAEHGSENGIEIRVRRTVLFEGTDPKLQM